VDVEPLNLDIEVLEELLTWLRETGRIEADLTPEMTVLEGGISSRTVQVSAPGRDWVLKQALAELRVPVPWFSDTSRVHREASALRWLENLAPTGASPRFEFEDEAARVVCMSAVPQPHDNWKSLLLKGEVNPVHIDRFAEIIGTIHLRSNRRLNELEPEFADRTFFESLRLEPYYAYSAAQVPEAAAFLERLQRETRLVRSTLVHGDLSPKNVLVRDDTLVLVDHEVAHIGDPAFDLGFSCAHFLSKARHVVAARNRLLESTDRYWSGYLEIVGEEPWSQEMETRVVRHTLACLLARAAGRSQLEYFDQSEKTLQIQAVLHLIEGSPRTMERLVHEWSILLG
jgi:aminoglycoside phosphotransferase (APT) family kinase protein